LYCNLSLKLLELKVIEKLELQTARNGEKN